MYVTSVLLILICASCTIAGDHGSECQAVEYIFNTNPASWNQAQEYCEKLGSRLVTFTTKDKFNAFLDVYQEVRESKNSLFDDLWIGLYDSKPSEGLYIWTDCTNLSSFTKWNEDEPNNQKTERCIRLDENRKTWRTRECYRAFVFACERLLHSCWFDDQVGRLLTSWKTTASSLDECKSLCSSDKTCAALTYVNDTCFHGNATDVILDVHAISSSKVCQRYMITNENFTDESPDQKTSNHKCDALKESIISCLIEGITTMSSEPGSSIGTVHFSQTSTTPEHTASSIAVTGTSRESTISEERYISETLFAGLSSIEKNQELIQTSFKSPGEEKATTTYAEGETSTIGQSERSTKRNSASAPANAGKDIGQSVERSVTIKCTCVGKTSPKAVEDKVAKISKELTLNKTALSSHKRKLTSAPDKRTSATISGVLGLTIIVAIAIFAIFLDINRALIWIKRPRPQ